MKEVINLIDSLILEHKQAIEATGMIQNTVSDIVGQERIEDAREHFVPGRFLDQLRALKKIEDLFGLLDKGLTAHFMREERALVTGVKELGADDTVTEIVGIFKEHKKLLKRLGNINSKLRELISGKLSQALWQSKAWDLRTYMGKTAHLLKEHMEKEGDLFIKIRSKLTDAMETNS